jgi:hypothetical protein
MSATRGIARKFIPKPWRDSLHRVGRSLKLKIMRPRIAFSPSPDNSAPSPYAFPVDASNPLSQLGEKYQPTKRLHNYLPHYWCHLRDIRMQARKVLEIGVQTDRSIRMWEEFFPNATIYGADIDPACRAFEGGRRKMFIGDQSDAEFCARLIRETGGGFDVIIDDGSHFVEHQIASFNLLFPAMSDHGIYVVEDTGGCVEDYDLVTVNELKRLVDEIMYWPKGFPAQSWPQLAKFDGRAGWPAKNVIGIAFYRWIVFVMRGRNPEDNPYLGKS